MPVPGRLQQHPTWPDVRYHDETCRDERVQDVVHRRPRQPDTSSLQLTEHVFHGMVPTSFERIENQETRLRCPQSRSPQAERQFVPSFWWQEIDHDYLGPSLDIV